MNKAIIFPGQGSQYVGMGRELYNVDSIAKEVFDRVDESVGYKLSEIIFNGPAEELALTANTQGAIMAVSIALFRVLMNKIDKNIDRLCSVVAGHSLGEYSALCAAGALSLHDTARLLQIRATLMQEACPKGLGSMAACIGISLSELEKIIAEVNAPDICEIANDNVNGQLVISGHKPAVERVCAILKDIGYRGVRLNVSAPFHCSLISAAKAPMAEALGQVIFNRPIVPVISNITVLPERDTDRIKRNLVSQICGMVRWRETMDTLFAQGITELIEIGPGKVLSGLAKKSGHDFKIYSISSLEDIDDYLKVR